MVHREGRKGEVEAFHLFIPLMICALYSHTYGGFNQKKVWKPFNVCMKEPANSSTVVTGQYLQVYSDGRLTWIHLEFTAVLCSGLQQGSKVQTSDVLYTLRICHRCTTFLTIGKVQGGGGEPKSLMCPLPALKCDSLQEDALYSSTYSSLTTHVYWPSLSDALLIRWPSGRMGK